MEPFLRLFLQVLFLVLYAGAVGAPALLAWGWIRWVRSAKELTSWRILSLVGFVFATASFFAVVSLLAYSQSLGGGLQHFNDPLFLKISEWGELLSKIGIILGFSGAWRRGPLQWHAPASGTAMLMWWLLIGGD
ncbi:MAG: hypothetical protein ABLT11_03600 [Candidatus Acidiferrum sp.]